MTRDLGQKVAHYSNKERPKLSYIADLFEFWLFYFGFSLLAGLMAYLMQEGWVVFVFFVLFFSGLFILARSIKRNRNNYVDIHEFGFVIGKQGEADTIFFDELKSIRWDSKQSVRVGGRSLISYIFIIEKIDDQTIKLTNLKIFKVVDLGNKIQQLYSAKKIPEFFASLQNGEEVKIGNYAVTIEGIKYKKDMLPWSQVESVKLEQGSVQIMEKDPYFPLVWRIVYIIEPNALLLHDFVNSYLHASRSR